MLLLLAAVVEVFTGTQIFLSNPLHKPCSHGGLCKISTNQCISLN